MIIYMTSDKFKEILQTFQYCQKTLKYVLSLSVLADEEEETITFYFAAEDGFRILKKIHGDCFQSGCVTLLLNLCDDNTIDLKTSDHVELVTRGLLTLVKLYENDVIIDTFNLSSYEVEDEIIQQSRKIEYKEVYPLEVDDRLKLFLSACSDYITLSEGYLWSNTDKTVIRSYNGILERFTIEVKALALLPPGSSKVIVNEQFVYFVTADTLYIFPNVYSEYLDYKQLSNYFNSSNTAYRYKRLLSHEFIEIL